MCEVTGDSLIELCLCVSIRRWRRMKRIKIIKIDTTFITKSSQQSFLIITNLRWNPNPPVVFLKVLQQPKNGFYSLSQFSYFFAAVSSSLVILAFSFVIVSENKSSVLWVDGNSLNVVLTFPTRFFISNSPADFVTPSRKNYLKELLQNLIASVSANLLSTFSLTFTVNDRYSFLTWQ